MMCCLGNSGTFVVAKNCRIPGLPSSLPSLPTPEHQHVYVYV